MRGLPFNARYKSFFQKISNIPERYLIPLKILMVYGIWKLFYSFTLVPGSALNEWWGIAANKIGSVYASVVAEILNEAGLAAKAQGIDIFLVKYNSHVLVMEHCLALHAMIIFTCSVLFFKGRVVSKIGFIAIGLVGIIFINILRLIFVCLAFIYLNRYFFDLNHSLIYVVITYGFIFLIIKWWMDYEMERKT